MDQTTAEPLCREFEKRTGIRLLARYDSEATKTVGLVQKIRAEAAAGAPQADVFWSGEIFHTIRLAGEGLLEAYRSEACGASARMSARYADPESRWHAFALRARVIAYHTGRVPAEQAPRLLEDLLDGRWKGRIAMARPEFGTTRGDVASWIVHYGRARAEEICRGLADNDVLLVDGNSMAVRMIATGRADVCMTDNDDVYSAQRNGWPVAMNFLDQGGGGALVIPNTVAVLRGASHPAEARALVDFLLSEDVERILARSDSHNTPVRPSVAAEFPQYAIPRALDVDYGAVADQLPAAMEIGRVLEGGSRQPAPAPSRSEGPRGEAGR